MRDLCFTVFLLLAGVLIGGFCGASSPSTSLALVSLTAGEVVLCGIYFVSVAVAQERVA